jgi:monovalent cation:H+ antiporter-2, CPA2 family
MDSLPFLLLAGAVLITFFGAGMTSLKIRIPSVLVYILLGIVLAGQFSHNESIHIAAEIGIVFLFFIVGLEFPLIRMMDVGRRIWPAGLLDVGLNLGVTMLLAMLLGLDVLSAFIIGSVAYATSSSITVKLMEEQKRLANPESEFILGLLIFEDLVAPLLVTFLVATHGGEEMTLGFAGMLTLKIVLFVLGAMAIAYFGFRRMNMFMAKNIQKDFMPLFAAGIALGYAGLALWLGLSEILGAFLAGVMLSETGKSHDLEQLFIPLRNIMLPFFFFWFGTTVHLGEGVPMPLLLGVCVLWGIVGKVLTGYYGGRISGLSPKIAARAGLSLTQRGEFSAIIASMAAPQLRVFSGVYVIVTAMAGVFLFQKAPHYAGRFKQWTKQRQARVTKQQT